MNTSEAKNTKTKKQIEAISAKIKGTRLKFTDIIIPLSVGIILLLLSVFVFVPMLKTAIESQAEYTLIKKKEVQLSELENNLKNMDDGILQSDLMNAKKVIPKNLKVSSFVYYVDDLAKKMNLTYKEISAGDIKIGSAEETKKGKYILGVSGPLSYTGKFEDIMNMLDSLYSASPYIISVENIRLEQSSVNWQVELNITGFYVPENVVKSDLYSLFTPYTKYSDIVKIFETKADKLD